MGSFYRTVPLPEGAITDQAKAAFDNGVLANHHAGAAGPGNARPASGNQGRDKAGVRNRGAVGSRFGSDAPLECNKTSFTAGRGW